MDYFKQGFMGRLLCIQTLGLTTVPPRMKSECKDAVIQFGSSYLKFSDFEESPHQERVCAYRNFINKVNIESAVKRKGSTNR